MGGCREHGNFDRLKALHLVTGKVQLLAQVPRWGCPPSHAPTVSSGVVCPDLHSTVDVFLLFSTRLQFWMRSGSVVMAGISCLQQGADFSLWVFRAGGLCGGYLSPRWIMG